VTAHEPCTQDSEASLPVSKPSRRQPGPAVGEATIAVGRTARRPWACGPVGDALLQVLVGRDHPGDRDHHHRDGDWQMDTAATTVRS
jgi:hypothetical protein